MRLVRLPRVERALQDGGLEAVRPPAPQGTQAEHAGEGPAEDDDGVENGAGGPHPVGSRVHHVYMSEGVEQGTLKIGVGSGKGGGGEEGKKVNKNKKKKKK